MGKYNFRTTDIRTRIPPPPEPKLRKIRFSFVFYDPRHKTSTRVNFKNQYPKEFASKLKEYENWTVRDFTQCKEKPRRIHSIDWKDPKVEYNGFGLASEYNENAWQFAIKGNKYGRVHGFFILNVFHIVWLDPQHKVYPRK